MRAVRGVWDSSTIRWVVELEGGVTRRGRHCVGVVFAFPVRVQYDNYKQLLFIALSVNCLAFSLLFLKAFLKFFG